MSDPKINYRLGRLMYHAMTDAAGYPNGMAYWEEMSPGEKYHYCCLGLDFLDSVESDVGIPISRAGLDYGFSDKSRWGEGDCKELMDHIESVQEAELSSFNQRVESVQAAYKKYNEAHERGAHFCGICDKEVSEMCKDIAACPNNPGVKT